MIKAIFAGSFDPITNGHLDIIERSLKFCDKLIVCIGINSAKKTLLPLNKRKSLIIESIFTLTPRYEDIEVDSFDGLLVNYAKDKGAQILIRGVRSNSDFEYETNLANANKLLVPEIETIFIPTKPELAVVSSSMVKEIHKWNGDISRFVPDRVNLALKESSQ
jgi:pantetheine-phosphate adenylyltransferase